MELIAGIALGLAEANIPLLGRSLVSEVAGAAWVLAIGYGVGVASHSLSMGSEILSRTSPNILLCPPRIPEIRDLAAKQPG